MKLGITHLQVSLHSRELEKMKQREAFPPEIEYSLVNNQGPQKSESSGQSLGNGYGCGNDTEGWRED